MIDLKAKGKEISLKKLLWWYIRLYQGDKLRMAVASFLALGQSLILVPIPLLFGGIIDKAIPNHDAHLVLRAGALGFGLYVGHAIVSYWSRVLCLLATKKVTETLRARLCMQLQQMSISFHDAERASELHPRVVLDTERIDVMGNAVIVQFSSAIIMFLGAACLLSWINFKLFIVTILMVPVYYIVHEKLQKRMRDVHRGFRDAMEAMDSRVNELLQSIRLVKTFAREEHEQRRAEDKFQDVTRRALDMTIFSSFYASLMGFLTNLSVLLVYIVGGYIAIEGEMTAGEIVAFAGMLGFMLGPIGMILGLMQQIYSGLASLGPVYVLLNYHEPLEITEGKTPVSEVKGDIEFDHVTLVYTTSGHHALREVSVKIHAGETVALVGESGAGKSTFANLVLGFYIPQEGSVAIDGRDIRDINLRELRERIGVVSQDNVLLNTSIRENLLYGNLVATEEEMREAARNANALEFIEKIPAGFDAVVGDHGARLSGGQRQRLAIARALLKDPRILILDEATSALDSDSESKIQEALVRLQKNRTSLVIAHRLSTVMNADRILVFRQGALAESGTHRQLIEQRGEYAHLCEKQFGAAIDEYRAMSGGQEV